MVIRLTAEHTLFMDGQVQRGWALSLEVPGPLSGFAVIERQLGEGRDRHERFASCPAALRPAADRLIETMLPDLRSTVAGLAGDAQRAYAAESRLVQGRILAVVSLDWDSEGRGLDLRGFDAKVSTSQYELLDVAEGTRAGELDWPGLWARVRPDYRPACSPRPAWPAVMPPWSAWSPSSNPSSVTG